MVYGQLGDEVRPGYAERHVSQRPFAETSNSNSRPEAQRLVNGDFGGYCNPIVIADSVALTTTPKSRPLAVKVG